MMICTVDIKTRFIPDDQRIYIVFPGEGYRFYSDMKDNSVIFLDIPGFPLPTLKDDGGVDDTDFIARLTMSERIKYWHTHGRDVDATPVRKLKDLKKIRTTDRKIQFSGAVRNFYYGLRKGDIVIVPPSDYQGEVIFGEIIDDKVSSHIQIARYQNDVVPVRKVKWVASLERQKIPSWLERKIPIPNPVHQIESSHFNDVFDIMYQRYHFKDYFVCKYSVTSSEFSSLDDYLFQEILLYVTALYAKNHDDGLLDLTNKSIADLVREIQRSEAIPDLRININSPGHIVSYGKTLAPIIVGVLIALSASNALADSAQLPNPPIQIINTTDASKAARECQADIQREVLEDLNAMGYARWQEVCKSEQVIRKHTGLNVGITVKNQHTNETEQAKK